MAKTYIVATNGNDGWPGTEAQPFRTIKRGINALAAGDTLLVKDGTYVEELDVEKSGTASAPLTIKAYPGSKPVIDGRAGEGSINSGLPAGQIGKVNPETGAGMKFTGLFDINGSNVVVDGFEITRSMGRGMRVFSPNNTRITNVTIQNCNIHHNRASNLIFTGSKINGQLPISGVKVINCELHWAGNFYPKRHGTNVGWPGCLTFRAVENGLVRGCKIHNNWGESILLDSNDGGSRSFVVEDNILYDNMASLYLHAVTNVVLQRNFIYRSITDKQSRNPFGPSISVAVSPAENPRYVQLPSRNLTIVNNILIGDGKGFGVRGTSEKMDISDVLIAYNTIVNPSVQGISAVIVNKRNIVFRNNIIFSSEGAMLVYDGGQTNNGWIYSNNMYSSRPAALNGPNDVIGNPKFRNASGFPEAGQGDPTNYQILTGSPAINAGFNLSEPKDDFFKNIRTGTPDIGGHEQNGSGFIQADFEATPLSGPAPLSVTFQDTSSSSASISEWLWDFGDGTISGQQNPTHVFNEGSFTISLRVTSSAGSDTVTKTDLIAVSAEGDTIPSRVTDGLQVLYRFDEGSGRTIHDLSGVGNPLDLQIQDLGTVNWLEDGLSIVSPAMIASTSPAEKIYRACVVSNEITLEGWIKPANTVQAGPARILSISQNAHSRNVSFGQGLWGSLPSDVYDVRLRTTERSANGLPSFSSPEGSLKATLSHVVYTRNRAGFSRIFLDGRLIAETIVLGDFSTWNPRFPLLLANETTGDYPWLGDLHLLAVYDRALGTGEVEQNYEAGFAKGQGAASLPLLLPVFKRFYIANRNGTVIGEKEELYTTFGVQYPDLRCVTCKSNGDLALTVHENIRATLRSYGASEAELHWID